MKNIIKYATAIFIDGIKEDFEVIRIIDKGALIGKIIDGVFKSHGLIPVHNIEEKNLLNKKIYILKKFKFIYYIKYFKIIYGEKGRK
jgi:hypothetical protein